MEQEENKWKNSLITKKQYEILEELYDRLIHIKIFKKSRFKKYMKEKFKIENLNQIQYKNYNHITKTFEKEIKLNKREMKLVKKLFTKNNLSDILNIDDFNKLRLYDMRKLLRYNAMISFNLMITDKTNIPKNKVQVLHYNTHFEYGIQESKACMNNQMFYIKFYDYMMLDFDNINYNLLINLLNNFLSEYTFRIYKTKRGFHVFIVSEKISFNDFRMIEISKKLKSDLMYTIYCKFNGYNIRLTPKLNDDNDITHICMGNYGDKPIDNDIKKYIKIFDKLVLNKSLDKNIIEPIHNENYNNLLNLEYINDNTLKKNLEFIEHIIKTKPITYDLVNYLAPGFIDYLKKPQRIFISTKNLYIANDMNTNIHYICYNDIMMIDIDIDHSKENLLIKNIENHVKKYNNSFALFKTRNGYHVFVLNKRFHYKDKETIEYMIEFGNFDNMNLLDCKYLICSHLRGFCVRLNKKVKDEEEYELINYYNKANIDQYILDLVNLHIFFSNKFWKVIKY